MLLLIDIPDTEKAKAFIREVKTSPDVNAVRIITAAQAEMLTEIIEIKHAHRLAAKVKAGKLKVRPARELSSKL